VRFVVARKWVASFLDNFYILYTLFAKFCTAKIGASTRDLPLGRNYFSTRRSQVR
jgi:hypothetical protein